MPLYPEPIAIPVVKGINVTTSARLLEATDLLEAENVRFPTGSGAMKRRGHAGARIRGAKSIPVGWTPPVFSAPLRPETYATGDRGLPGEWVYGYGYAPAAEVIDRNPSVALETSAYPESGLAFGAATRDSESLVWDGFRLLSRTESLIPGGRFADLPAVMPALRAAPLAKANVAQGQPDAADNGVIRVAAWISNGDAYYSVVDSALGTTLVPPTRIPTEVATQLRCVPCDTHVHVVVADSATGLVQCFSMHQNSPAHLERHSMGPSNGHFDVWKRDESRWLIALSQTTQVIVRWVNNDGSLFGINLIPVTGTDIGPVAVCTTGASDVATETLAIVWRDGTAVKAAPYNAVTGDLEGTIHTLGAAATNSIGDIHGTVAIAPKWLTDEDTTPYFNAYWDSWNGTQSQLTVARWNPSVVTYTTSIFHKQLASAAFRAGDRTFVWVGNSSTYQSTWLLLDETLRPVGHQDYVIANVRTPEEFPSLASVNWWGSAPAKDRLVFHFALGFRVRVPVGDIALGSNVPAVYSESSIRFSTIDFLPRLRSAQAGRCTYFAGAQLWSYDGLELVESGFHLAPENVVTTPVNGGNLTTSGTYIYRIDLCYRNAQNEEVRSASFFTAPLTLAGDQKSVTLTLPTVLTRRSNAYFLIFRNESAGTLWYLVNSRNPAAAKFVVNDQSVASVTLTDDLADVSLLSREQHPGQTIGYLDHFAAPACEVIGSGRDRLWVAGGEIAAGQIYPSRLFDPGEAPSFNGNIAVQIDRSVEAITAIGFLGEHTAIFRRSHCYILDGEGPDNVLDGNDQPWQTARLALTDVGAIGPEGLALISQGLLFPSPAGIRLLSPGSGILPIGQPVDVVAKNLDITAAVVVGSDQEVRFYSWDGPTLVYNYQYNTWSTWTIRAAGAARSTATGLAVVATPQGVMLTESEGLWTDNTSPYRMRVRFAWLHAGGLADFQRVRRVGGLGSGDIHRLHVDIYYNERDFAEEWFDWSTPDADSQNTDTFGSGTFGSGNFGDGSAVQGVQFRDSTWPWRRRLKRQKCSVISVAIDDNYTNGEGFTLMALALELAKKNGLDRSPWRGGTYSNTGGNGSTESGI